MILEVDERPVLYRVGHIPGAHGLDWHTDLQDPVTRDIPTSEAIQALWARVGIDERSFVVVYGDKNNWYACFAYWLFRLYGLRATGDPRRRPPRLDHQRAADLDRRASARQLPAADAAAGHAAASHLARGLRPRRRFRAADRRPSPEEYRGEMLTEPGYPDETAQRPGHIPGALSVPWDLATRDDGTFRSLAELAGMFSSLNLEGDHPTITYCRIGERSAHTWFVLHELLGWSDVRNYDGSWTEWGSMVAMPVALGDQPGRLSPRDAPHATVRDRDDDQA